jgi:hypothetical protein
MTFLIDKQRVDFIDYEDIEGSIASRTSFFVIIEQDISLEFMRSAIDYFVMSITLFLSVLFIFQVIFSCKAH